MATTTLHRNRIEVLAFVQLLFALGLEFRNFGTQVFFLLFQLGVFAD
jgi:hypothetical protein